MNKAGLDSVPEFPKPESVGPRNWGEEKRGRKGRKNQRGPRRRHRGNNRRRSER